MTKLVWDQDSQKKYQSGVDRGVFYPSSGPGVPWNGLISVEESFDGGESNSYYFDGVKTLDTINSKTFQASIAAFSTPEVFSEYLGDLAVVPGLIFTRQARRTFSFSYRSLVGDAGYKLHLVYNALATPTSRRYSTTTASASSETRTWKVDAVPPESSTYRPTAHYILDSTKIDADALLSIETVLYGSLTSDPRLPSVDEVVDLVSFWDPVIITEQLVTGLADLTPGLGDLTKTHIPGLFRAVSTTRLVETVVNGLYRLE